MVNAAMLCSLPDLDPCVGLRCESLLRVASKVAWPMEVEVVMAEKLEDFSSLGLSMRSSRAATWV